MAFPLPSNPVVRGMAVFYTTTFLSAAWSMIIPTIPVLAQYFGVTAGVRLRSSRYSLSVSLSGLLSEERSSTAWERELRLWAGRWLAA